MVADMAVAQVPDKVRLFLPALFLPQTQPRLPATAQEVLTTLEAQERQVA
jgi:hypothetical protein